ncbi:tRNA pseudouridine synthase B [candidate division SR1 bacterium]|nr:tRNA pseudouridine synthase B [candidate division SR1 bacterium]
MLIAVNKPKGITSFDVVKRLKHVFPGEKIGHSGTLDPLATGLMILGIGKGTKKLNELIGLDKSYTAQIDFSKRSDTWDLGYWDYFEQLDTEKLKNPKLSDIESKLSQLIPSFELPLPAFSAKQKDGKRFYELARKGKIMEEKRLMKIDGFAVLNYDFPILKVQLDVGSGTYIRSIAYRLGGEFGIGGILTGLRRTRIGERDFEESWEDGEIVDYHMRCQIGTFEWLKIED